jgi:hypothetical protein
MTAASWNRQKTGSEEWFEVFLSGVRAAKEARRTERTRKRAQNHHAGNKAF